MLRFLSIGLALVPALSAQAFQLPNDYGRFGPHDTAALARVEGDAAHVQVNAYGDAPVVQFLMDTGGVRRCLTALGQLKDAEPNSARDAPAAVRCAAQSGSGTMEVFKRQHGVFQVEFSNSIPGNIVALTLDEPGLAKAIAVFQAAAGG